MARPKFDDVMNLDAAPVKRELMAMVGRLTGEYEVTLKPVQLTRSNAANRYYFAAVVKPFYDFLHEQEPDVNDPEQAHIELKRNVLGTRVIKFGDTTMRLVPTTHDMDSATFWDYVERARAWLQIKVGILTMDPGQYGVPASELPQAMVAA